MSDARTPLVYVMAHSDAQDTFDRHIPYWESHAWPVRVMCPVNGKVITSYPLSSYGGKQHHGATANARFRFVLTNMYAMGATHDRFMFYEYDSLCLDPNFNPFKTSKDGVPFVAGNVFTNDDHRFKGKTFIHPPLAFNMEGLRLILATALAGKITDQAEYGFWDRWLGLACDIAGITPHSWGKHGFSRNTIDANCINEAKAAVRDGAVMVHGVKDASVLVDLQTERTPQQ